METIKLSETNKAKIFSALIAGRVATESRISDLKNLPAHQSDPRLAGMLKYQEDTLAEIQTACDILNNAWSNRD